MRFTEAIRACLRKYVTFSGRASRPEYWWFFLFLVLASIAADLLDKAVFGVPAPRPATMPRHTSDPSGPIASVFGLVMFLPSLAAAWRRMHDTGRSGLFVLYPLIAAIGVLGFLGMMVGFTPLMRGDLSQILAGASGIILLLSMIVLLISPLLVLWWLTRPSQPGPNQYGPNPNEVLQ